MSEVKLNRDTFASLIAEDIDAVNKSNIPKMLAWHIIAVLEASTDLVYGKQKEKHKDNEEV